MLKIIIDTSVVIRFILSKNNNAALEIFGLIERKKLKLFLSTDLLKEINNKLTDFNLRSRINDDTLIFSFINFIRHNFQMYEPVKKYKICRDKNDNFLLDLADQSEADFLITYDKDLLVLHVDRFKIVTPYQFLELYRKKMY